MAAAGYLPGVSLREATQRKLRRFSELRGISGGAPALPCIGKEGNWEYVPGSLPYCYFLPASHLQV